MERRADGTQPGGLRANAWCCPAHTSAAGQGSGAVGFAQQNGYQTAAEHPPEAQPAAAAIAKAFKRPTAIFSVSVSFPMKSVSVCA